MFLVFQSFLHPEAWKVLGALLASWTGDSANMVAVQDILQAPENIFGYALITDTLIYSIWLTVAFSSVAVAGRFDRFTRARSTHLVDHGDAFEEKEEPMTIHSLAVVVFGSLFVAIVAIWIGGLLPELGAVVNATTWTIVIVSVLGLIIAVTPLGRTGGSTEVATLMLFVVIGQIAAGSDFSAITQAPLYLLDEPTQQLDVYYRQRVFELVTSWVTQEQRTVLCTTHDLDSLPGLPGYFINLSRPRPELLPISAEAVQAEYAFLARRAPQS